MNLFTGQKMKGGTGLSYHELQVMEFAEPGGSFDAEKRGGADVARSLAAQVNLNDLRLLMKKILVIFGS